MNTFLVGGARSGKSRLAEQLAANSGEPVTVVVTAEPIDAEMAERIERHRADRPDGWTTIEAPYDLAAGIAGAPAESVLLLDCVTLWLSNMIVRGDTDDAIESATAAVISALLDRERDVVVVSNEVGMGLVPPDPMSRRFRDAQGRANQALAAAFDRTLLVAAGRALLLHPADEVCS